MYPIVHPFIGETTRGAEEAAQELGVEAFAIAPDTPDISKQVSIIEGLIAQGINGIGLGVLDPTALTPYINEAIKRGIPASNASKGRSISQAEQSKVVERGQESSPVFTTLTQKLLRGSFPHKKYRDQG